MKEMSQTSNVVKQHRLLDFFKRFFLEEDIQDQEEDISEEFISSDTRISNQDKKELEESKKEVKKMEIMQEEKREQEGTPETKKQKRKGIAIQTADVEENKKEEVNIPKVTTKEKARDVDKEQEL